VTSLQLGRLLIVAIQHGRTATGLAGAANQPGAAKLRAVVLLLGGAGAASDRPGSCNYFTQSSGPQCGAAW
jgi:hypothetical protein